jgi:hypothetical protein
MKRDDFISWDDYFMAVAVLSAQRSKDPSTQVSKDRLGRVIHKIDLVAMTLFSFK